MSDNAFKHKFDCSRVRNDCENGDQEVFISTPFNTGYISKNDVIEMAKFYNLKESDLET